MVRVFLLGLALMVLPMLHAQVGEFMVNVTGNYFPESDTTDPAAGFSGGIKIEVTPKFDIYCGLASYSGIYSSRKSININGCYNLVKNPKYKFYSILGYGYITYKYSNTIPGVVGYPGTGLTISDEYKESSLNVGVGNSISITKYINANLNLGYCVAQHDYLFWEVGIGLKIWE